MRPNISILRTYGVLDRNISSLMNNQLSALMLNSDRFEISILKAKKLGFNPKSGKFICAVRVMTNLSESNWEQKMEAYKSFGLSDEEFLSAFKLNPLFMESSEKKIRELMDFFVRKLEWKPSVVSKYPKILICSLEKNIIPRCSVLQILMSKGLVRKDLINIPSELVQSGMTFMNKFVIKYQGKVPEVVAAYQGKMRFEHFQSKDFTLNPKISPRQC
ncbi:hypothetical protein GIB67_009378 [Kingdonia uniflora]|uniref:Uncharacterized protein n=1 Tax=Kingdonia uniflora TaxID=39325 RepID=A0A7J7N2T0_9MAGN|nr:hypothetical protein GIB67_009378 [Kingdonia uniflora]